MVLIGFFFNGGIYRQLVCHILQDVASCDLLPSLHVSSFSIYTVQSVVDSRLEILGGEPSL